MCEDCGCTPCKVCGSDVVDGVCSVCKLPPSECTCMEEEDMGTD